jgi:hypothetical protein
MNAPQAVISGLIIETNKRKSAAEPKSPESQTTAERRSVQPEDELALIGSFGLK